MIPSHRFEDYAQRSTQSSTSELEELHREHEMQTSTERSEHSWLNKGHPLGRNESINWKLGALLLGDGHIGGTPNEGLTQSEGLKFFHQFTNLLTQKAEAGDDSLDFLQEYVSKIKEFSKQISEAETYSNIINEIADQGKDTSEANRSLLLDRYADNLLDIFKRKGGGWLPIGWTTRNGESHAMLAHIDMKGKMTIVNTGGGTNNHPLISVSSQDPLTGELKEELKVQEFITYEGINKSKLERSEFFRFFLELQVRSYWDGLIDFSAENIYGPLKNYLSVDEKKALSPFKHPKAYKKPQKSGSCAIKSISTTLYYMLTDSFNHGGNGEEKAVECYKKMKYLWQTQALVELGLQIGASSTKAQKHFLEDFVENMSRSAEKLHKKGLLEEKDLIELNWTVEDIRRRLDSSETIQEEQPTLAAIEPGLPATAEGDSLYPKEDIFIREDDSELTRRALLGTRSQSRNHTKHGAEETLKMIYEGLPRIHAIASPSEKTKEFLRLLNTIDPDLLKEDDALLGKEEQGTLAHALLEVQASFISTLPIPVKGEPSVWSQMSATETVEAMESVCQLMDFSNQLRHLYIYRAVVVEPVGVKSNTANIHFKNSEFNNLYGENIKYLSAELTVYREDPAILGEFSIRYKSTT